MNGLIARLRSLWRGVRLRSQVEAEMNEEFRLHVELHAQELKRAGLSASEALRRARAEFGSPARYMEEGRVSRGLHRIDALRFSWLDFKLGFRMLSRYPGLTVVGGLAMAFAIWIGAASFELITQYVNPKLPLPDSERLVGVQLWHTVRQEPNARALHDFVEWRQQLVSIDELSAFRKFERNLIVGDGAGELVHGAEVTASAFGVARVRPVLGRVLLESDEHPSAAPVVVIGYDVWQKRLDGVLDVVGRTIRLSNVHHTVVGVMPRKFGFPEYEEVWTPMRLNVLQFERGKSPGIGVFGRLAPGVTIEEAQAELSRLGARAALDWPETHQHLRPRVLSYARSILPIPSDELVGLRFVHIFVLMLVALVCSNVALLIFARAATREDEIIVRNALGASRGRIIAQLFAEALVLGSVGAVVGLAAARYGLRWAIFVLEGNLGRLPFWFGPTLSERTLLYTLGLTLLAAAIAGVVPALRVTRGIGDRLRQATAGGGGLKFSGIWTVVIVAQVAVTVAFPAAGFYMRRMAAPIMTSDVGFSAEHFLSARLGFDGDTAHYRRVTQELKRRLTAEPAVAGVAYTNQLPRTPHMDRRVELLDVAGLPRDSALAAVVNLASVDGDYFNVLEAGILAGRGFHPSDISSDHRVIIVNQSFVDHVMQGRSPLGQRVRLTDSPEAEAAGAGSPSYEIVGVVKDLGMNYIGQTEGYAAAGVYLPLPSHATWLSLVVRVKGAPAEFAQQLHVVATEIDPSLRLYNVKAMDQMQAGLIRMVGVYLSIALLVSSIALLLSFAGIYAVMAFAVSRRTREIGVRVALGADARRIMFAVFRRPLLQVGVGVVIGGLLVTQISRGFTGGLTVTDVAGVGAYAVLMMGVCMLACVVPVRRALSIQPTDALRNDG
jgi:putative ABC transport system permease protein